VNSIFILAAENESSLELPDVTLADISDDITLAVALPAVVFRLVASCSLG